MAATSTRARSQAKKPADTTPPPPNNEEELNRLSAAYPKWRLKLTTGGTWYAIRKVHLIETDERIDWGFRSGLYESTPSAIEEAIKVQEGLHAEHNVPL